jgi:hypothetical protein
MITSLNEYTLNTKASDYSKEVLLEFGEESYDWPALIGITRLFKNEKFYHPLNNKLFGRECPSSIVATIDDVIYKIYFNFHDTKLEECAHFRAKIYQFIVSQMGDRYEGDINADPKAILWKAPEGNVVLECVDYDTAIILTSSSIGKKKDSFFGRLFS